MTLNDLERRDSPYFAFSPETDSKRRTPTVSLAFC